MKKKRMKKTDHGEDNLVTINHHLAWNKKIFRYVDRFLNQYVTLYVTEKQGFLLVILVVLTFTTVFTALLPLINTTVMTEKSGNTLWPSIINRIVYMYLLMVPMYLYVL